MKTIAESNGTVFMGKNLPYVADESLLLENQIARKKEAKEKEEVNKLYLEAQQTKQEEINSKLQTLELLPMGSRVLLSAYPENPYRKVVEGNLIVDYGGSFFNKDKGTMEKMEVGVGCAKVIEAGPACEYLQAGDDVYYDTRTVHPCPFMGMGYVITHEQGILCVLNEKLKERFKMD